MTAEQFTYWLQGFVELNGAMPNEVQWKSITDHLKVVFNKVTPNRFASGGYITSPGQSITSLDSSVTTAIC